MRTRGRRASEDELLPDAKKIKTQDEYSIDNEEIDLIYRVMGISEFSSSKGKDHSASDCSYIKKVPKRKTRQFIKPKKK